MSTDDSLDIFNAGETGLSDTWASFLATPEVNCSITATPAPSGSSAKPSLLCQSKGFWNLMFDTTENFARYSQVDYNVSGNALLGLSATLLKDPGVSLGDILPHFDITEGDISGSGLVKNIINAITTTLPLKLDASPTSRCCMWLTPGQVLRTDTALTFELSSVDGNVLDKITQDLCQELGISPLATIPTPTIFLQRTCWGHQSIGDNNVPVWDVTTSFRLTFRLATAGFLFWVILEPNGMSCSITPDPTVSGDLWTRLDSLGGNGLNSSSAKAILDGVLSAVELQSFSIGKDVNNKIWWRVNAGLQIVSGKDPVSLSLSYDSQSSTFSGGLMLDGYYATAKDKLLPSYEAGQDLDAPAGVTLPSYWDVKSLFSEAQSLPSSLPTAIAVAEVHYQMSQPSTLWVAAKLIAPPAPITSYVPAPFVWNELDIRATKSTSFACDLRALFTLSPRSTENYLPANLGVGISYSAGNWVLTAYAYNLSFGLLYSFFDTQYTDPLVSVLGKLNVASLDVLYTYEKGGSATSFVFTGVINLGDLQLRLFYQYASSKAGNDTAAAQTLSGDDPQPLVVTTKDGSPPTSNWIFECDLGATGTTATIGTIVSSIVDDASNLPPFVSDIPIPAASGRAPIYIKVAKTDAGQILFVLRMSIESFTLTFVQVADKDKTKPTKRLLRFAVDKIPLIQDIPLLNQLPQPFDQLEYIWVNDTGGLLQSEVAALNASLLSGEDGLLYKQAVADKPTNVVLAPGHHFVVVNNNAVAIDHVFYASKPTVNASLTPAVNVVNKSALIRAADPTPASPPAKGALTFTLGPLSISAVALQYKEQGTDKYLFLTMDATFTLGPISFSLLGFSIGLLLTNIKLNNLSALLQELNGIQFALTGLALGFDKPPLLLAGAFEHQIVGTGADRQEIYLGGIGISFPPYTFVGVGEYAILNDYKSVFIYAKLDGPLIELEFATISGVRLGLGFNSMVRSPTIDQLYDFPFIDDAGTSGAGNDPMKILKSLTQVPSTTDPAWVSPKNESYWLAAGMSVKAFDVLTITAVAMFAFRDSGLIISIFADAVAQMPPTVTDKNEMIVYVEIGLVADMNFVDGYFRVEASLAPTSFLLVPACHVYGGFALVYWFGKNPHAGDWVFSVGGYHRAYTPPAWYPVPRRIGISFMVGDCLSVTGEAYFAITPKVAMGGAMIHASLSIGIITAWLDAAFDALVNFHPLHYITDFSISIGVSCDIDVWFIHIHISVSVGAMLHIEGPEFGGYAHVDFYVCAFDVDFGASNNAPDPLTLQQFWDMLHQPGPDSAPIDKTDPNPVQSFLSFKPANAKAPVKTTEDGAALKFILENGSLPQPQNLNTSSTSSPPSTGAGAKWFVKGGTFQFRIATDIALSHADIAAAANDPNPPISLSAATSPAIYSRPMQVSSPIISNISITISEKSSGKIISGWQNVAFALKTVPTAVWGPYDVSLDPIRTSNPSSLLNGDNPNVPLALGIMITAPLPILAESLIPAFNATAAAKSAVLDFRDTKDGTGKNWILAPTEATQTKYLPSTLTDAQKKETNEQRWAEVQTEWEALKSHDSLVNDVSNGVITLCASIFGWAANRPQTETKGTAWGLKGGVPSKLIANLESTYLALPRIAVGSS